MQMFPKDLFKKKVPKEAGKCLKAKFKEANLELFTKEVLKKKR